MFTLQRQLRHALVFVVSIAALYGLTAPAVMAEEAGQGFVPVVAPRNSPSPIPHTDVLASGLIPNFLEAEGFLPQARAAGAAAEAQAVAGKPGVLQATSDIASGLTLFDVPTACADFGRRGRWDGEMWTMRFAQWGPFAADDGYFQAKNVTFDRELSVGPGINFDQSREASLKIASNQPYDAGVMSPPFNVRQGRTIRVRVNYLIYNHGQQAESLDYASMAIIPKLGERGQYVFGYQRGQWGVLEQEVVATGDQFVVMLQGHSPAALNSNIYFDNVEIYVNDRRDSSCRN